MSKTVGVAGWKVSTLSASLDMSTLLVTTSRTTGHGMWTLAVLDDQQKALSLGGSLDFEVAGFQPGSPSQTAHVKGTLGGDQVEFAIEAAQEIQRNTFGSSEVYHVQLQRNGQTSSISANVTTESKLIAYNFINLLTHLTAERDGQRISGMRNLSIRVLNSGETEMWVNFSVDSASGQPPLLALNEHFYQRVTAAQAQQFYDRYDLQLAGSTYSLQAPAQASLTADGKLKSDLVVVDGSGKPLSSSAHSKSGGEAGIALISYHKPDPAVGPGTGTVPVPAGLFDPASICGDLNTPLGSLALSIGIGLGLAAFGGEAILADIIACSIASTTFGEIANLAKNKSNADVVNAISIAGQVAIGGACGGGGVLGGLGNLASAAAGAACNADPYFIDRNQGFLADDRSMGPVQITRVTGGLVRPDTAARTGSAASASTIARQNPDYDERPEAFVGGSVPSGASAVGEWTWDQAHPFGAEPSHTQAAGAGPQKHYFIHASNPLQVGPDDNIVQYVYLDPKNPPAEIYLQFYTGDGDGEHRAYWGTDRAQTGGKPGTASLYPMGALPAPGGWVRLKVPADKLELSGKPVQGILFGAYDGQTWWGPTTTSSRLTDRAPDSLPVISPDALPTSEPGAEVAFQVADKLDLGIAIVGSDGVVVRTLRKEQAVQPGYYVEVWDARDDKGAQLPDKPYTVRFLSGGKTIAEAGISISPFVAHIVTPSRFSLIRGNDIPVIGEAYGPMFSRYVVEYGAGLNPTSWTAITTAASPVILPKRPPSGTHGIGNLANWDVGVNEFTPYKNVGLNGVYTLRLREIGKDGREAADSVPVIVGGLAHSAEGGTIISSDGQARLIVPPLATQGSFALMALVPTAQIEPDAVWRPSLPSDKKLIGGVYEVFPADQLFRRPATLELPYDPAVPADKVGVMLGDGQSWRYIGGRADPAGKVVTVSLTEFGGSQALVAAFSADQFGPVQAIRTAGQPLSFIPDAPLVTSSTHPAAFYYDFASTAGEVSALDQFGTQLTPVKGTDAGLSGDNAALKVTRLPGGMRLVRLRSTPYDATKFPILTFDYRLPPPYVPNILVKSGGVWWQLKTGPDGWASSRYYQTLRAPDMLADDKWHHYQIDVLAWLRANLPPGSPSAIQIDEIALGQVNSGLFMQVSVIDSGGSDAYYITNVAALAPVASANPALAMSAPAGGSYTSYSSTLDQKAGTIPPEQDQSAAPTAIIPPGGPDGQWYFHVRGKTADGKWSATAHYPLLIDRQPPLLDQPSPAPDGAGAPTVIELPIHDAVGGIDPASIRFTLNGQTYSTGRNAIYDPQGRVLIVFPYSLEPPLPPVPNGQKVEVSITAVSDYAGNKLSAPFTWRFTADQPRATGNDFRSLTLDGESPALSPDASQVAFVSKRSGIQKIWIIRADDFDEKAKTARLLIAADSPAQESDPVWSPDGTLLAYVSDANGSLQIWVAHADGSGARALTAPAGNAVASPSWSPDGRTLVFIQDGNLWQVNGDGSGQHALTAIPDQPYQSVRWQPGGQLLALAFNLYERRIELYDMATGDIRSLTHGGEDSQPTWLNAQTVLYTAPAGQGQPDAIWQIGVDGSGQAILTGSGQAGVNDMQSNVSANGNATALVSTRSGARAVWLRAVLQISRFNTQPANGVPAGKPIQITYTLPVESNVTLQVLGTDGAVARALLDSARQPEGPQSVSWNGTDASNKLLAPGTYTIKLVAKPVSGGDALERLLTTVLLDPGTMGNLKIQVNQWAGQPIQKFDGQLRVYPQGARVEPVAEVDYQTAPTFDLPAGQYDVVATLGDLQREVTGISVEAGKTTSQSVDMGLGGLHVSVQVAPGQPADGAFVTVARSNDRAGASAQSASGSAVDFVLPPGSYDVQAEYRGVRQVNYAIPVTSAQVTQREIDLGSALLRTLPPTLAATPAFTATSAPSVTPLLTWTPGPTLGKVAASGSNRIAFASKQNNKWDIYIMKPDRSGLTQLTTRSGDNRAPAWSADGGRIAFAGFNGGISQIFTMTDDGKNVSLLTGSDGSANHPSWSPDGKSIAYDFLTGQNRDIYVIATSGGALRVLASSPADDSMPAWSPDGRQIAFVSMRDGNKEIYVINADGSGLKRLTDNSGDDASPAWSPDGKQIAFVSNRSGNDDIYLMNADGSGVARVVSNPANDESPTWSADGKQIAFTSIAKGLRQFT
ncbi:MAG TPA: FlgD immunoglobulin-like domain containing protein [Aggregatilineaceae bacterium]|nr:FlgD immunoglobulin-like domain containing protein [Aggregatilineaceae bacterium]